MTDENLETKARRGFKWYDAVLGIAITGAVAYGAIRLYDRGVEIGHQEERKEIIERGFDVSVEPKIEAEVTSMPIKDAFTRIGNYSFFAGNCTDINETLYVSDPASDYYIYDVDGQIQEGSETWQVKHDGIVDALSVGDYVLIRERDYEANKAFFDEADRLLKEKKEELASEQ